jgi:hypothetical protein
MSHLTSKKPSEVNVGDQVFIHILASKLPAKVIGKTGSIGEAILIQRNGFDQWCAFHPDGKWKNMDGDLITFA